MKKIITLLLLLIVSTAIVLEAQRKTKIKTWFSNYDEAIVYAKQSKLPVLMVFAGTDWCEPCIALRKYVLNTDRFQQYYPSRFSVLYLEYPVQEKNKLPDTIFKHNEELAKKYNPNGYFPNLVFIDASGNLLATFSYNYLTTNRFIKECDKILKDIKMIQSN
jgi:thioredoxin-related protein